jgi:hypothetical protein
MESPAFPPQIKNKHSVARKGRRLVVDGKVHIAKNREQRQNARSDVKRPVHITSHKGTKQLNKRRGATLTEKSLYAVYDGITPSSSASRKLVPMMAERDTALTHTTILRRVQRDVLT